MCNQRCNLDFQSELSVVVVVQLLIHNNPLIGNTSVVVTRAFNGNALARTLVALVQGDAHPTTSNTTTKVDTLMCLHLLKSWCWCVSVCAFRRLFDMGVVFYVEEPAKR